MKRSSKVPRDGSPSGTSGAVQLREDASNHDLCPVGADVPPIPEHRVRGEIARGGMGAVLEGLDAGLGRRVAIKLLLGELAEDPVSVQRFLEEARVAGQLQHPGIVPVYDLGRTEDGRPFFTMKLVRGDTLAERLARRSDPTEERLELLEILLSVCQAVAYAHSRGVVHRDLKPSNVMVGAFGEVQVVDWGLAKVLEHEQSQDADATAHTAPSGGADLSRAGSILGTPRYMAPEQARGEVHAIDPRSDVFSLGSMLCELLTGTSAYEAGHDTILASIEAGVQAAGLRLSATEHDRDLARIALDCLRLAPSERPTDASEVARRIRTHLDGLEARGRALQIEAAEARVKLGEERRARRLTLALASTVLAALVLGVLGWRRWESQDRERVEHASFEARSRARDARALLERARALGTVDLSPWTEAAAALQGAEAVVQGSSVDEATRLEVEELARELREERSAAARAAGERARDERMRRLLRAARLAGTDRPEGDALDDERSVAFEAAFRSCGIDPLTESPERLAERFGKAAIAADLAAACDAWSFDLRRRDESGSAWRRLVHAARALDPEPARDELRAAYLGLGIEPEALSSLVRELFAADAPVSTLLLAADLQNRGRDHEAAIETMHSLSALHPRDVRVHLTIGQMHFRARPRRRNEAIASYRIALALEPDDQALMRSVGIQLGNAGRYEEARRLLQALLERWPRDARAMAALGAAYGRMDLNAEAKRHYRAALVLQDDLEHCLFNLGVELRNEGQYGEAAELFERALLINPNSHAAWRTLGQCQGALELDEQAEASFTRSLALRPRQAATLQNRGFVRQRMGRLPEALDDYTRALGIDPKNRKAWENLAQARVRLEDYEGAQEAALAAQRLNPSDATALIALVRDLNALEASEQRERALELADQAVAVDPGEALAWHALAGARLRLGDHEGAREALVRGADSTQGGTPESLALMALVRLAAGDRASAEELRRQVLEARASEPDGFTGPRSHWEAELESRLASDPR